MTQITPAVLRFPDRFVWGAATSAYQIEGAVTEGGRGSSIWDTFSHTPGKIANGDTGDVADDHLHRYREDVALMRELGLRAYRFSVAWPRIVPDGSGEVNQAGLDFYRRLVDALLEAGIEPVATLYHWDLPQALEDLGGWRRREIVHDFARYAEVVYHALHDGVRWWATHNEPYVVAYLGHHAGIHAPGLTDLGATLATHHHLLVSHGLAVQAMRAIDDRPRLGIVLNLELPVPLVEDPDVDDGARRVEGILDRSFTDPVLAGRYPEDVMADHAPALFPVDDGDMEIVSTPIDWLGVNYYRSQFLDRAGEGAPLGGAFPGCDRVSLVTAGRPTTDIGWPHSPEGLTAILTWLRDRYPDLPPILITENGAAYDDPADDGGRIHDTRRIGYLEAHLAALHAAIGAGVDVRGYLAWSLLDNFEWAAGYAMRFGLVHVDYETLERTPRDSALWYRDVIAQNGLDPGT